jgi:hypothetical protein
MPVPTGTNIFLLLFHINVNITEFCNDFSGFAHGGFSGVLPEKHGIITTDWLIIWLQYRILHYL